MAAVITAAGLTKAFGHRRAVDGLDIEVARAEVFGFLGPNGAGKSAAVLAAAGSTLLIAACITLSRLDLQ